MKNRILPVILILFIIQTLSLFSVADSHAFGRKRQKRQTKYMIILGDSITAGLFGNTQVENSNVSRLSEDPPLSYYGLRPLSLLESKKRWSWASGSEINSVRKKLDGWLKDNRPSNEKEPELKVINMAESGAHVSDIKRQLKNALNQISPSSYDHIALIAMTIGANDACRSGENRPNEAADISNSIQDAFAQIAGPRGKPVPIFVAPAPKIPDLGKEHILQTRVYGLLTCAHLRTVYNSGCENMVVWKTEDEYELRMNRVRFINSAIQIGVDQARSQLVGIDAIYDPSFFEESVDPDHLAVDCFHPGRIGQSHLAENFWSAMPWFK